MLPEGTGNAFHCLAISKLQRKDKRIANLEFSVQEMEGERKGENTLRVGSITVRRFTELYVLIEIRGLAYACSVGKAAATG